MKKGIKIALIALLSVVAVAGATIGILYAVKGDYVRNRWALLTKDDKEYYEWVTDRRISSDTENIKNSKTDVSPDKIGNDTIVTASVSEELGKLIGLKDFAGFRDAGIEFETAKNSSDYGLVITPLYNNVDIISLAGVINTNDNRAMLGITSFSEDVVDISDKIAGLQDNEKFAGIIENYKDIFAKAAASSKDIDKEKAAEEYKRLMLILRGTPQEPSVEKNVTVNINGIAAEANVIGLKLNKSDIAGLLKDLIAESREKTHEYYAENAEDFDRTIDKLNEKIDEELADVSMSGDITLDVDDNGDIIGYSIKIKVNELSVKLKCLTEKTENDVRTGVELDINTIKALSAMITSVKTETATEVSVNIEPGELISTFIGMPEACIQIESKCTDNDNGGLSVDFDMQLEKTPGDADKLAEIKFSSKSGEAYSELPLPLKEGKLFDFSTIADSEYVDVEKGIDYLIGKLKAINDPEFNNFITNMLGGILGDTDIVEFLETMKDSGLAGMLSTQLKAILGGNENTPETDNSSVNNTPDTNGSDGQEAGLSEENNVTPETAQPENTEEEKPAIPVREFVPYDAAFTLGYYSRFVKNIDYKNLEYDARIFDEVATDPSVARNAFLEECGRDSHFAASEGYEAQFKDDFYFSASAILAGRVIPGYSFENCYALLGRYDYGEGIDDRIVGMKVGDTVDLEMTLDSRYGAFEGYKGTFRITCTDIAKYVEPEWTESYIVDCLGYPSLEECDIAIGNDGGTENVFNGKCKDDMTIFEDIKNSVFESVEFEEFNDVAYGLFLGYINRFYLIRDGICYNDYFEQCVAPTLAPNTDLEEYNRAFFSILMKKLAVYAYIAEEEGITLSAEQMQKLAETDAEVAGMSVEEFYNRYPDDYFCNMLIGELCDRFFFENANIIRE